MAYGDFKDLARRTASGKVLRNKVFSIAKNPKYDGYQRGLASMVYKFFDEKSCGGAIKSMPNQRPLHNNLLKHYIYQLLTNLKEEKYIHHSETIFGVFIYLICN